MNIKDNICDMGDSVHPAWDVCCTGCAFDTHGYVGCVDGNIHMARLCLLGRPGMESMMQPNEEYVDIRGWSHGHTYCNCTNSYVILFMVNHTFTIMICIYNLSNMIQHWPL